MTLKKENMEGIGIPDESIDWYGNDTLHNLVGRDDPDINRVKNSLLKNSNSAVSCNQFGRTPLHYCLDRINVNKECLSLLVQACPEALYVKDNAKETPYDLARKWKHSNKILFILLQQDPSIHYLKYLQIKYGYILGSCYYQLTKKHSSSSSSSLLLQRNNANLKTATIAPTSINILNGNENEVEISDVRKFSLVQERPKLNEQEMIGNEENDGKIEEEDDDDDDDDELHNTLKEDDEYHNHTSSDTTVNSKETNTTTNSSNSNNRNNENSSSSSSAFNLNNLFGRRNNEEKKKTAALTGKQRYASNQNDDDDDDDNNNNNQNNNNHNNNNNKSNSSQQHEFGDPTGLVMQEFL